MLQFTPKGPGTYRAEIIMTSAWDIRIFNVECHVTVQEAEPTLEFTVSPLASWRRSDCSRTQAPARQSVTQEIPLTNTSDDNWTMRAFINGKYFTGPSELLIPPRSAATYSLTFSPQWAGEVTARLELTNGKTSEKSGYNLIGIGQEPLAEDSVRIECQARTTVEKRLVVRNFSNADVVYTVESDLPNISGASTLQGILVFDLQACLHFVPTVPAMGRAEYILQLTPQLGGVYNGSVTFVGSNQRFLWFAVEVVATSPKPEGEVKVSAFCRKAASVQISITNPLDEVLAFDVELMVRAGQSYYVRSTC